MARLPLTCALLALALSPLARADSPFNGTWKADLDRDRNTSDSKADEYELLNGTYSCRTCTPAFSIPADGQDHPVSGSTFYDTLSVRVIDARTVEKLARKDGHTVADVQVSVAEDGQTQVADQKITLPGAAPIEIKDTLRRLGAVMPGAHAISGRWVKTAREGSDNVDLTTFRITGDTVERRDAEGSAYTARLDGTEAPYTGNPVATSVSVRLINDHTLEQTDRKEGGIVMIERWTVDSDGTTMHTRLDNMKGRVLVQIAHKQP